jgi:hypothetical protein
VFADYTFIKEEDYKNEIGVLLTIEINKKNNFFIYNNDNSAFTSEDEVLFNEGLTFKVKSIEINKEANFKVEVINQITGNKITV